MAFLKSLFTKKNEYDDGQSKYFKEDFAPVVNQPSRPKPKKKAEVKVEEPKKAEASQPDVVNAPSNKTAKSSVKKAKAAATKEIERRVAPKPVERIVNPKGADARRQAQKAAEAAKKAEEEAKRKTRRTTKKKKANANPPEVKGVVAINENDLTSSGKWDIQRAKDGRFFFSLYASNHTVIAYSQMYSSSSSAMNGINSVITNAPKCEIEDTTLQKSVSIPCPKWEIYFDKSEEYRFRLYAANGLVVCHSAHGYASKSGCKGGIDSIKRFCTEAKVDKSYLK